jgi:hypothetical protein
MHLYVLLIAAILSLRSFAADLASHGSENVGKWQKIYWTQGSQAALEYCNNVAENLEVIIGKIYDLSQEISDNAVLNAHCEKLISCYQSKKARYEPDVFIGEKVWSRGRAEPGKTPFSYRDFRHRYNDSASLIKFFDSSIQYHQDQLNAIEELLKGFSEHILAKEFLRELQIAHNQAVLKWNARKAEALANPAQSEAAAKDPLDVTNIRWAHEHNFLGEQAEILVIEQNGADIMHKELDGVKLLGTPPTTDLEHGTHVCGIIGGRKMGAAPSCVIHVAAGWASEIAETLTNSSIDIINFSGDFPNVYSDLLANVHDRTAFLSALSRIMCVCSNMNAISSILSLMTMDPKDAQEHVKKLYDDNEKCSYEVLAKRFKNKLLILAIGNDGLMVGENEYRGSCSGAILKVLEEEQLGIFVVNVRADGVQPSPHTNYPGDQYASITVCAPGTDILSAVPGDQYAKRSGTSMAAPYVSSLALLLRSAFPSLDKAQIRHCILSSATSIILENGVPRLVSDPKELSNYSQEQIAFSRRFFGQGLINAKAAFECAEKMAAF